MALYSVIERKRKTASHSNRAEPQGHCAEQSRPDTAACDSVYKEPWLIHRVPGQ